MVDTNYNLVPKSFYNEGTNTLKVDAKLAESVQAGIQARLDQLPPVQEEAFLAMTANLAPGDIDTPEKLNAVLDAFEAAAKLIGDSDAPVSAFVGDIAKFLARAMIEFAGEQRQNALNDRMAARETAKAELLSQAATMDEAAEKMKAGATTALIMGVVGGAASVAGSLTSALGTLSQLKSMATSMKATQVAGKEAEQASQQVNQLSKIASNVSTPGDVVKVQNSLKAAESAQGAASAAQAAASKAFDTANVKSQMYTAFGQVGNALGDTTKSAGAGIDGRLQADAKAAEAEGARDAAEAQYAQQTADMKKEIQDTMNEMIKQIINFLKELKEAEVDAMRALTRV